MSGARIVLLCGGIGGAKLALGLDRVLRERLMVVVNTGDDFRHLGLDISPDIDTVLYTLAGLNDPVRGWGRRDETWHCMDALGAIGGETWFSLGDRDLALHLERTRRLAAGESLSAIVADVAARFGVTARVVPMSDDPVRTIVATDDGALPFQEYFVRRHCAPAVRSISFAGADNAQAQAEAMRWLADPSLSAIVIAPSNPYLSVDPILAMPGMRDAIARSRAPVIAVSPVIGGDAVKGPTAKIMRELGIAVDNRSIATHYAGLIDALVIDRSDVRDIERLPLSASAANTLMRDDTDKVALAQHVVDLATRLQSMADAA